MAQVVDEFSSFRCNSIITSANDVIGASEFQQTRQCVDMNQNKRKKEQSRKKKFKKSELIARAKTQLLANMMDTYLELRCSVGRSQSSS